MKPTLLYVVSVFFAIVSLAQEKQPPVDSVLELKADSVYALFKKYVSTRNYVPALENINALITLRKQQNNNYEWVRAMSFKAELSRSAADLDNAIATIESAEPTAEDLPPSTVKSVFYNRKAAILFELKRHNEALQAVKTSQRIDEEKSLTWQEFSNLNIEGSIYRDLGESEKARSVLRKTCNVALLREDTLQYARALYNLGLSFYRDRLFDSSIVVGKKIIPFKHRIENLALIDDAYRLIATSFRDQQRFDSAYGYLDSAHQNSLLRMETVIQNQVDAYKMKNELENEKLQNTILEAERDRAQLQLILLVSGLVILILIVVIFFRQKQQYKKLNAKQQELNQQLEKSIAFKNKLISIVAHDIRNPMGALTGLIQLYNSGAIAQEEVDDFMQKLDSSAHQVNTLLENLMNWVLYQKDSIAIDRVDLEIAPLFKQIEDENKSQLEAKSLKLKPIADPTAKINADRDMLALVLRNLVTNAIKFSQPHSTITLKHEATQSQDVISIIDQGVGMTIEQVKRIKAGEYESNFGTQKEKGSGLGLQLCQELIQAHKGSLAISSVPNKGTTIQVRIPRQ